MKKSTLATAAALLLLFAAVTFRLVYKGDRAGILSRNGSSIRAVQYVISSPKAKASFLPDIPRPAQVHIDAFGVLTAIDSTGTLYSMGGYPRIPRETTEIWIDEVNGSIYYAQDISQFYKATLAGESVKVDQLPGDPPHLQAVWDDQIYLSNNEFSFANVTKGLEIAKSTNDGGLSSSYAIFTGKNKHNLKLSTSKDKKTLFINLDGVLKSEISSQTALVGPAKIYGNEADVVIDIDNFLLELDPTAAKQQPTETLLGKGLVYQGSEVINTIHKPYDNCRLLAPFPPQLDLESAAGGRYIGCLK
jgi:hypothetical protein